MRVLVAAALDPSQPWANAINTIKMAEAFALIGHKVTVACYRPDTGIMSPEAIAAHYGLRTQLRWVQTPKRLLRREVNIHRGYALLSLRSAIPRPDLVYCRNYTFPWLTSKLGIPTVGESHAHADNDTVPFLRFIRGTRHRAFRLLVTISDVLADYYRALGTPPEKIAVLPDAVDLSMFTRPDVLPPSPYTGGGPHVAYTGHLYDYKGIPTVLEAAALLPDVQFHLVGGWPHDVKRYRQYIAEEQLHNVTLYGLQPHVNIPSYLWHADVLLLPPSADHPSARWTSPVKLGEYLAAGVPVVTTAIPALRDWLTDDEVYFVAPDAPRALADGIRAVLTHQAESVQRVKAGLVKVQEWSYQRRVERILERI